MSDSKTYIFPENGGGSNGLDPNLLFAMNGNNGGFGNGNWLWIIFLFFLYGWRGNGFGGNGAGNELNGDYGRAMLMDAIGGNRNAIENLATQMNCSTGQIQTAINSMMSQVQNVANQVGMSAQQTINAINAGNCGILSRMNECCCNLQDAITRSNYDNRIAISEQTNALGGKIDGVSKEINDRFCALEMREMQNKIDTLREMNSTLKGQIDNAQQTSQIVAMTNQALAPIANAVAGLQNEVASIKCGLPKTIAVPENRGVYLDPCVAANLGFYGNGFFNGNNGLWG